MASPRTRSVQRIISLPIVRSRNRSGSDQKNASKILAYYQFQLHLKSSNSEASQSRWVTWMTLAQSKVASTWSSFGRAPEGNWKLKLFQTGERIMDRIDYEELALKGIAPSLGPTILNLDIKGKGTEQTNEKQKVFISLIYPPSIQSGEASLDHLRDLVQVREPKHKKGFWTWLIIAPFTAPFMIFPIIPNLPFFFCAWRSWSHYKAYRSSQYLTALIKHGHVVPVSSTDLDMIYKQFGPKSTNTNGPFQESSTEDTEMLLTREAIPAIVSTFSLKETSVADMLRALEQVRIRSKLST